MTPDGHRRFDLVVPKDPPGLIVIDDDTVAVFWGCLCEAGSADDCDCPDAVWFERAATRGGAK